MAMQIYTCRRYRSVGVFQYSADFAEASSNIMVRFADGCSDDGWQDWHPTPFQVASCRHNRREAERMIADYHR